jgi:hypothetical protein
MRGVELPQSLASRPFTVSQGRDAGVRLPDLRTTRLHAPTHGVRTASVVSSLRDRAAAFAAGMPSDVAFSHATAARLLALPLTQAMEADEILDVTRASDLTRIRRVGCRGHRGLERREVIDVDGLRVVDLADTWCDLGELPAAEVGVDDLVVVGDVIVNRLAPGGHAALRAALESRNRPRGKARLTEALSLVRVGSRSPMETRSRLMFHRAGFPEPALNADVFDAHGGWLLEGDLVWKQHRVIGEYQGADHASRKRRSADSSRTGLAGDEQYTVIEIYAEDVYGAARRRTLLRRFARAMDLDPASLQID